MKHFLLSFLFFWVLTGSAQSVNLYTPSNGTTVNGTFAVLQWYDVANETGYAYQVDSVNTFDSPNLQSGVIDAFNGGGFPALGIGNLRFGTTYYWRIAYLNGTVQSDWSAVNYFVTISQPSLYAPSNGATVSGTNAVLQ